MSLVVQEKDSYRIDGVEFTRVSRVLDLLYPKPWMQFWQRKVGFEQADKTGEQAANEGTICHDLFRKQALGEPFEVPTPEIRQYLTKVENWRESNKIVPLAIDDGKKSTLIKSDRWKVAGRFDELSVAEPEHRKFIVLIDYKFGRWISGSHEIQLGIYSLLLKEDWKKHIDRFCIFYPKINTHEDDGIHWYHENQIKYLESVAKCYLRAHEHYREFERENGRF